MRGVHGRGVERIALSLIAILIMPSVVVFGRSGSQGEDGRNSRVISCFALSPGSVMSCGLPLLSAPAGNGALQTPPKGSNGASSQPYLLK